AEQSLPRSSGDERNAEEALVGRDAEHPLDTSAEVLVERLPEALHERRIDPVCRRYAKQAVGIEQHEQDAVAVEQVRRARGGEAEDLIDRRRVGERAADLRQLAKLLETGGFFHLGSHRHPSNTSTPLP